MRKIAILLSLAPVLIAADKPIDWHAAAVGDVEAAYRIYRDNHPGWFDPTNRRFKTQLEHARAEGLRAAGRSTDLATYSESLGAFSAAFADGHARAFASVPDDPKLWKWPGFVAAWRNSSLRVFRSSLADIPVGLRIQSCDGKPIRTVISERLRTQGMRLREAGHWWARSPRAFVQTPLMGTPIPKRCVFTMNGRARQLPLQWTNAPDDLPQQLKLASDGEASEIGLTEPRPGIFMVGLPTFNPSEEGAGSYQRLFQQLENRHADLERARAVVLDLRGNDGGSSDWGLTTAKSLWGDEIVEQKRGALFRNVQIWWRASKDNIAYSDEQANDARKSGSKDDIDYYQRISSGMSNALRNGKRYYVDAAENSADITPAAPLRFHKPVYVFVPGRCTSACLDALDIFKLFPDVHLVGAPSAADSVYIDVRLATLPSTKGSITVPLKIWKHRPRLSGQIYKPDIEIDDLDWSTAVFLSAVERDLTHH